MRLFLAALLISTAMAQPRETAYAKWLNQDVFYLISAPERAAFQALQTDSERLHFIEQFWLQRDQTPASGMNGFKEEHYRRLAYSNDRFASPKRAGWQTDRGRMYIVYGPPDEIESHPPNREAWRYHKLDGVGVNVDIDFVDPVGTGELRMSKDPATPR